MSSNGDDSTTVFDAKFDDVFVIRGDMGGEGEAVFATTSISMGTSVEMDDFIWIVKDPVKTGGETRQEYAERMRAGYVTQWCTVRREFSVSHPKLQEWISQLQPRKQNGQLSGEWLEDVLRTNGWAHKTVRHKLPLDSTMLAIYKGSKFNHSCTPSLRTHLTSVKRVDGAECRVSTNSKDDPRELWVEALRAIPAGEEATVSYLGTRSLEKHVIIRRAKLMKMWGFKCVCPRCIEELATHALGVANPIPTSTAVKRKNDGGCADNTQKKSAQQKIAHADHATNSLDERAACFSASMAALNASAAARETTPPLTPPMPQLSVTPLMPAILRPPSIPQMPLLAPIDPARPAANLIALSQPTARSALPRLSTPRANPSGPGGALLLLVQNSQEINASVMREAVHNLPVFRTVATLRAAVAPSTTSVTGQAPPAAQQTNLRLPSARQKDRKEQAEAKADHMTDGEQYRDREIARTRQRRSVGSKREGQAYMQTDIPTYLWKDVPPTWRGQLWQPGGQRRNPPSASQSQSASPSASASSSASADALAREDTGRLQQPTAGTRLSVDVDDRGVLVRPVPRDATDMWLPSPPAALAHGVGGSAISVSAQQGSAPSIRHVPHRPGFFKDSVSFLEALCASTAARELTRQLPLPQAVLVSHRPLVDMGKAATQGMQQCALRDFLEFCLSGKMQAMIASDQTPLTVLSVLFRLIQHVDQYESTRGQNCPDVRLLQTAQDVTFRFYSLLVQFVKMDRIINTSPRGFETSYIQHNPSYNYLVQTRSVFFGDDFASRAMRDFVCFVTHNIPEMQFDGSMRMAHDLQWWHSNLQQEMARYACNSFTADEKRTKNGSIYSIVHMLFMATFHPSVHIAAATAVSAALWNTGAAPSSSSYATAPPVPSAAGAAIAAAQNGVSPSLNATVSTPPSGATSVDVPFASASASSSSHTGENDNQLEPSRLGVMAAKKGKKTHMTKEVKTKLADGKVQQDAREHGEAQDKRRMDLKYAQERKENAAKLHGELAPWTQDQENAYEFLKNIRQKMTAANLLAATQLEREIADIHAKSAKVVESGVDAINLKSKCTVEYKRREKDFVVESKARSYKNDLSNAHRAKETATGRNASTELEQQDRTAAIKAADKQISRIEKAELQVKTHHQSDMQALLLKLAHEDTAYVAKFGPTGTVCAAASAQERKLQRASAAKQKKIEDDMFNVYYNHHAQEQVAIDQFTTNPSIQSLLAFYSPT
jgi:hypothetical protein